MLDGGVQVVEQDEDLEERPSWQIRGNNQVGTCMFGKFRSAAGACGATYRVQENHRILLSIQAIEVTLGVEAIYGQNAVGVNFYWGPMAPTISVAEFYFGAAHTLGYKVGNFDVQDVRFRCAGVLTSFGAHDLGYQRVIWMGLLLDLGVLGVDFILVPVISAVKWAIWVCGVYDFGALGVDFVLVPVISAAKWVIWVCGVHDLGVLGC
ncbi:hypothetical protein FA13DRAFT_1716607 [Coprinellus micaceus]|uniref:Uncharacterized protein n=1 Tax=Coprinellus micaceus TaxID=71717 RepID=A0A4Y7SIG5_COPMI|nr:hypothetical protein FA13DRAFT_1716607 [Coprinellus micaceus]